MKKIIAAGVDRVWQFDTQAEADKYLANLKAKRRDYNIIYTRHVNGKIEIRVREQYNNNKLIAGDNE